MKQLIEKTRSVRRYEESRPIDEAVLRELIDCARLGGSARNAQVLKYMIVRDHRLRELIFPQLGWAGYLTDWPGPEPGERPAAYVICLLDTTLLKGPEHEAHFDLGIATQNLLLAAADQGIFGCRIGSFSGKLAGTLRIDERYKILLVLALGYPAEQVVVEETGQEDDIRYWRDEQQIHHVPKRSLDEIIVPVDF